MNPRPKTAAEHVLEGIAADVARLRAATGSTTVLGAAVRHLSLDRRGPNGHAYDLIGGGRSEVWCWTHERPVTACHAADQKCDGEAIIVSDPTGEAALHPDDASATLAEVSGGLVEVQRILDRVLRKVEMATSAGGDLRSLGDDTKAEPGCESCARIDGPRGGKWWNPPHGGRTTLDGALPHPMLLCKTCRRDVLNPDVKRLPSKPELEKRRDGKRVMRRAS